MKRVLWGLFVVLCFFSSCARAGKARGGEIKIGISREPKTLDPQLAQSVVEQRIYPALFEGLLDYDPQTGSALAGLAESWTVSADGLIYTFKLRNATWSDGVPITAHTVVKSWLRMLSPDLDAPYAWFPARFIEGAEQYRTGKAGPDGVKVRAVDDYTFEVRLLHPVPFLIQILPHFAFSLVPLHVIDKYGQEWCSPDHIVSNGPYVLNDWRSETEISLVRNDRYWDKARVPLARVVYHVYEDVNTAYDLLMAGDIDWLADLSLRKLKNRPLKYVQEAAALKSYFYIINITSLPLSNVKIRKALDMSINRTELVNTILKGGEIPATSLVPPLYGYPGIQGNPEDLEKAKMLLKQAGYPGGEGLPTIELLYTSSIIDKQVAFFVQQEWQEKLGIKVELVQQEWQKFLNTRRLHDFQLSRGGWIGDFQDPVTFLNIFLSTSVQNGGKFINNKYDDLLTRAQIIPYGEKRFKLLAEAEAILVTDEQAIIPLFYYPSVNIINLEKWGGWYPNILDIHPVKNLFKKAGENK